MKSINENVEAIGAIMKAFETFLNDISGFRKSLIAKREEIEQDPFVQDFEQSINEYTDIMTRCATRKDMCSPTHNLHLILEFIKEYITTLVHIEVQADVPLRLKLS